MPRLLYLALITGLLTACSAPENEAPAEIEPVAQPETETVTASTSLSAILEAQPDAVKARYDARHPEETLTFFGIEPGMTVAEVLPGGGWYTKLLLPYLGGDGALIGVNYATSLWPNFAFANDEYLARMAVWTTTWTEQAEGWRTDDSAAVSAHVFGEIADEVKGSADAVLFFRALHNMARFNNEPFLTNALQDAFDLLKPGGIVGIVQHEARPEMPDAWANGNAGYLKRDFVIAQMQAAGFEFEGASDINQNASDQPSTEDVVWRLPPSFAGADEDSERRSTMAAIGESNRMTLKFRKPSA